jgi:hypothetical protein
MCSGTLDLHRLTSAFGTYQPLRKALGAGLILVAVGILLMLGAVPKRTVGAVSSLRITLRTKRQQDGPLPARRREKRGVHVQHFGATFPAVQKRRNRRQIIEQRV